MTSESASKRCGKVPDDYLVKPLQVDENIVLAASRARCT